MNNDAPTGDPTRPDDDSQSRIYNFPGQGSDESPPPPADSEARTVIMNQETPGVTPPSSGQTGGTPGWPPPADPAPQWPPASGQTGGTPGWPPPDDQTPQWPPPETPIEAERSTMRETPVANQAPSYTPPPTQTSGGGGGNNKKWIYAGLGCLGLLLCACLAFAAASGSILSALGTEMEDFDPETFATQVVEESQSGTDDPTEDTDEPSFSDGENTSVFELSVGECFNDEDSSGENVSELPIVPCDEPHDNEIYALVDHPGGSDDAFPGDDEMDIFSEEACLDAFEPYVGIPFEDSELTFFPIQPTEGTWDEGDREVVCVLYHVDMEQLEGSMAGSNR